MKKKVVILRGIPGSGKSTYAERLSRNGVTICSADNYFTNPETREYVFDPLKLTQAHSECMRFFLECLMYKIPEIVVDNTNITKSEYQNYAKAAEMQGYEVEIIEFVALSIADIKECVRRCVHKVPEEVIAKMAMKFESNEDAIAYTIRGERL